MAKMYPAEVRPDTPSDAEKKVFDLLRLQLSDDWSAFHSVGLATHGSKPWAEIDFVVVGPSGVYCLEVKGGRLEREGGRYRYTDRNGKVTTKSQGPFEQVGPAAAKLYHFLKDEDPSLRDVAVGYGIITPDITWKITGPDILPEVIFDERDLVHPLRRYFDRLANYWHRRLESTGKKIQSVDKQLHTRISTLIRGDFDLRPSLKSRVTAAKSELIRLTEEQYQILDDLEENERVIIKGGAGSGKTLLAIEEARRRGHKQKVLLVCYNRGLGELLKKAVSDITNVTAGTLHSFMAAIIRRAGLNSNLPPASEADLYQKFYPEICQDALLALDELESFDVLIVDEAQDLLLETYMEVFNAVVKGGINGGVWRFFMDANQNLFGNVAPAALAALNAAGPAKYSLSVNCRNTSPIAVMTALLSGIKSAHTLKVLGPEVIPHWYSDKTDERTQIANAVNRVLGQKVQPNELVILGPWRLENSGIKDGLPGVPYAIRDIASGEIATRCIRYATFGAFKGLESDYVLVIDIEDLSSAESLLDIYVGTSRACAYLELFIANKVHDQYDERAKEFGRTIAGLYRL